MHQVRVFSSLMGHYQNGNTVEPLLTNVPTYEHFNLQTAQFAKFCFYLRTELQHTNGKRHGKRAGNLNLLTVGGEEAASL